MVLFVTMGFTYVTLMGLSRRERVIVYLWSFWLMMTAHSHQASVTELPTDLLVRTIFVTPARHSV